MVAISLYKGNLHKVPADVPRRWLIPRPKISPKDFRVLLRRRAKALSRLQSHSESTPAAPAAVPASSNLNPIAPDNPVSRVDARIVLPPQTDDEKKGEGKVEAGGHKETVVKVAGGVEFPEKLVEGSDVVLETKVDVVKGENSETPVNPSNEDKNRVDVTSDKAKRKKEVEEKLEVLNAKKHSLVQLLKQILSAEEALKGKNSLQGMAGRPPVPLQVDVTNDTGSMTRRNTPRIGSDGHSADVGGEGDDMSNNLHSRNSLRMNSTSPSPDSQHRKSVHNTIPFSSRTTMAIASSPSRFASGGKQGLPSNAPSVSISATNYIASTPSPAAVASGGGTPAFGDA